MHQTNSASRLNLFSLVLSYFVAIPISPDTCGVVFLWKYILEKWVFSLDRSNMQIFTLNITRVVWPHVPSSLDLQYFCRHNPLSYDLKLVPGHYWSWQRTISFLVNIFVRHTFYMSKSGIKTETVLTMTDTTEPTELLVIKISMCISVVLSYQPFPIFFCVKFVYSNSRLQSRIFALAL